MPHPFQITSQPSSGPWRCHCCKDKHDAASDADSTEDIVVDDDADNDCRTLIGWLKAMEDRVRIR